MSGASLPIPPTAAGVVQPGQPVTWGARPEYLRWSDQPGDDSVPGEVVVLEHLGASVLVTVDIGDEQLQAVVEEEAAPAVGDHGAVRVTARHSLLFDADGERIDAAGARA